MGCYECDMGEQLHEPYLADSIYGRDMGRRLYGMISYGNTMGGR